MVDELEKEAYSIVNLLPHLVTFYIIISLI